MDALPGYTNKTWFKVTEENGGRPQIFKGQCAELCGRNHANMYARVIGMRMADYKKWYADEVQAVKTAKTDVAKQQKALQAQETEGQ
jgi:cytochrome c oxidase subunit 2